MNRRLHLSFFVLSLLLFILLGGASPAAAGWRLVGQAGTYIGSVALPPSPLGVLYTSGYGTILRSSDGGATFASFAIPNDICPIFSLTPIVAPDPSQAGTLYASYRGNVWRTVDGGATWRAVSSPDIGWISDLAVLPDAPGHLLAVADSSVLPTLSPTPPCYPAFVSGVALSRDGGATWSAVRPVGSGSYQVATFDPAHVERLYLGTTAGDLFLTADGGTNLKPLDFPVHGRGIEDLRIDSTTVPSTVFARAAGQYYRAPLLADGTVGPWTNLTRAPENPFPAVVHRDLLLDPNRPGTLFTFTNQGVFASADHGDSWAAIPGLDPLEVTALALDPRPGGPLYAATRHGLYALDRGTCVESPAGACLNGFRFQVAVTFATAGGPVTPARTQALSADTADFWFFAPGNLELVVKVLDGRAVNGAYWVFAGGLSDVAYTVTVTDTATGTVKSYPKPAGQLRSFADTSAFPVPPREAAKGGDLPLAIDPFLLPDAAPGCAAGSTTLCLAASRFQVSVAYEAGPFAGAGRTVPLTPDTGAFWFLSPDNLELVVKVLDGRGLNGHFWVFYGALSDVAYTLTVTDTATGVVRTYTNPQGHLASFADTSAF